MHMGNVNRSLVLLVDDDPRVRESLVELFSDDYEVLTASGGAEAVAIVAQRDDICAIVMDIKMAGMDGLTATREISASRPDIPIILHTGYAGEYDEFTVDQASRPFDYVEKGNSSLRLHRSVRNAVELFQLKRNRSKLSELVEQEFGIIGRSKAMIEVYQRVVQVSPTDARVVILGESGTGKELVARAIHRHSLRRDRRLAIFNCNHKSPDLVESELFGHCKGAFTHAFYDRVGLFEYGDGGTVFLDEIGDLDISTQGKLLRVLESGEYQRVGDHEWRTTNVRLLCATNRELETMVAEGKFREDLYYRLRGVQIRMPALREHREDIPLLVERFLNRYTIECDLPPRIMEPSALRILIDYDWPGNVRWLQHTIESLVALSCSHVITAADVERELGLAKSEPEPQAGSRQSLSERMRTFKRNCIIQALAEAKGNVTEAARILGADRTNLYRDIKSLQIPLG
jgi:two-component system nitrogen regulation response regulator NtrX